MKDMIKVMKLDYLISKPNLTIWNLFFFALAILIHIFVLEYEEAVIPFCMLFGMMYMTYPFTAGDEDIDKLYFLLGLDDKIIVRARYFSGIFVEIVAIFLGFCAYLAYSFYLSPGDILTEKVQTGMVFVIFLFPYILFQLPILFKLEYQKAKLYYLFSFGVSYLFIQLSFSMNKMIREGLPWLFSGLGLSCYVLLIILFLPISMRYAEKVYKYD